MRIERFARDKQPHDFARAFENHVDAAIPQKTLDRDRFLPPARQRFRRFVTAPSAHLHRFIGIAPGRFCRPHLAHRGFDPQISRFAIDQRAG